MIVLGRQLYVHAAFRMLVVSKCPIWTQCARTCGMVCRGRDLEICMHLQICMHLRRCHRYFCIVRRLDARACRLLCQSRQPQSLCMHLRADVIEIDLCISRRLDSAASLKVARQTDRIAVHVIWRLQGTACKGRWQRMAWI